MLGPQRFFEDRARAIVERFGKVVAALILIEPCEVAQRPADVRMVGA
jgi:hypothetical protein